MKTLLQINSSIHSTEGQSSRLSDRFVDAWQARHPGSAILRRDLALDGVPHLTGARFQALVTAPEQRSAEQQAVVDYSDALIEELRRADTLVLGLPMYNFGVPSMLKAYFDHIARAGITFKYTATGPVGLLTGKKAYVFAARGGQYVGTSLDTQSSYVSDFLRFLGIADVEFVYAEGLNMGDASRRAGLAHAEKSTAQLFAANQLTPALVA